MLLLRRAGCKHGLRPGNSRGPFGFACESLEELLDVGLHGALQKDKLTVGQNAAAQGPHRLSAVQHEQAELLLQVFLELLAVLLAIFGLCSESPIGQSPLPALRGGALALECILAPIICDHPVRVGHDRKVGMQVVSLDSGTLNCIRDQQDKEDEGGRNSHPEAAGATRATLWAGV